MKRRRNSAAEAKKIVELICSNVGKPSDYRKYYPNKPNLNMAAELIQALYGQSIEYEVADWGTQNYIVFRFFMPQFSPFCPDAERFLDWVLTYFKADDRLYVHYDDFSMTHFDPAEFKVKLTCVKPKYKGSSADNYLKRLRSRRKNPKRRRNSAAEAKKVVDLICSNVGKPSSVRKYYPNKPNLTMAAELIQALYGQSIEYKVADLTTYNTITFKFFRPQYSRYCPEAERFLDWVLTYFKADNRLYVHYDDSTATHYDPAEFEVRLTCVKPNYKGGVLDLYLKRLKSRRKNPRQRKNSSQYARQLADLICFKNRDFLKQGAELIMTFHDTDWDKTQLRFGGSNDSIRWRFYHDKTEATKLYKFLGQYFASEKRISVYLQYTQQGRSYNVIIDCQKASRTKYNYISKMKEGKESKGQKVQAQNIFNPKRRRNTAYPKLEQLLCSRVDDDTLTQVAEMILALVDFSDLLLPEDHTYEAIDMHGQVHEFYHEENPHVMSTYYYNLITFYLKKRGELVYENAYGGQAILGIALKIKAMLPKARVVITDMNYPQINVYCGNPGTIHRMISSQRSSLRDFYGVRISEIQ